MKQNHTEVNKECEEKEVAQDRMRLPQDSVQLGVVRKDKRETQRTVEDDRRMRRAANQYQSLMDTLAWSGASS